MGKIIRRRTILACKRCFESKRKCTRERPVCRRCEKAKVPCEYFTENQISERIQKRRTKARTQPLATTPEKHTIPNTELDPLPRQSEKRNFKLLVNETGEYSKYFPVCLFPFCDHAANVSYVVDREPNNWDGVVMFNFATLVKPLTTIQEIRMKFPQRKLADMLVDWFFDSVHPFVPVMDREELFLKYNDYWEHRTEYADLNALILMYSVFFCSIQSLQLVSIFQKEVQHKEPDVKLDFQKLRLQYFQCIVSLRCLLNVNVTPSLSSMTSMILVYYVGSLNCINVVGEIATLVKYAQFVGLHRNISHNTESTPTRDMIYSYIWYLDSLNSYYTGLAPSINKDYFETVNNFPKYSSNLTILFSLSRFYSAEVSNDILSELNKITLSTADTVERIAEKFKSAVVAVNDFNRNILLTPDKEPEYLMWIAAEGRLGLWKAALLLNVLRTYVNYANNMSEAIKGLGKELVLYALLLVNESLIKITLGIKLKQGSMWFTRCSYPFQAMFIVLSFVQKNPDYHLNFSSLPENLEYTKDPELNYLEGDLRMPLVDKCIEALKLIKPLWPLVMQHRFERVLKVREKLFVKKETVSTVKTTDVKTPRMVLSSFDTDFLSMYGDELFDTALEGLSDLDTSNLYYSLFHPGN